MIKWNQKNMKECDKRKSHISSKLHIIYISSNNGRHPVTKTFTTLHSTSLHMSILHFLSFQLHPTALHYHLIWLSPISHIQTSEAIAVLCRCYLMNYVQVIIRINPVLRPEFSLQYHICRTLNLRSESALVSPFNRPEIPTGSAHCVTAF